MSETQSTSFYRRACYLCIAGAFVLLAIFFALRTSTSPFENEIIKVHPDSPSEHRVFLTPPSFDTDSFYKTLISNNLFRPFGWSPPVPQEPYRL